MLRLKNLISRRGSENTSLGVFFYFYYFIMVQQSKIYEVENLKARIEKAKSFYLFNYQGMKASLLTKLRHEVREANGELIVIKNSLFRKAVKDLKLTVDEELINGPTACLLGLEDEIAPLSVLYQFFEENGHELNYRMGFLLTERKNLTIDKIVALSQLPAVSQLQVMLLVELNQIPLRFLTVLSAPMQKMVRLLHLLEEKNQQN